MERDLTELLNEWPFEPGEVNVRLIEGTDGEPRIQVRLDLGILQMHIDGRPDGQQPDGYGSLLEALESRLDESEATQESEEEGDVAGADEGDESSFHLTPEDCRALREEALQFYHRYVALLVLEDYEGVVRDTTRNLRVLDLCAKYAQAEHDRAALEQFRPYITMMRARALASQALKDNEPKAAIQAIDDGIEALKACFVARGTAEAFDQSSEVELLRGMREALVPKLPVSQKAELRQRLNEALASENYELAAILRDELRMLPD